MIGRHIRGLTDFSGRESRQPFWLWVLIVYLAEMAIGAVAMVPIMQSFFTEMFVATQRNPIVMNEHPEMMFRAMAPVMRSMMIVNAVLAVMLAILLAAAMVRRLHDGDRSGWWALPQLALQMVIPLIYMTVMPDFFQAFANIKPGTAPDPNSAAFQHLSQTMTPLSLLSLITFPVLISTIVLLALRGTTGPNCFGDDPLGYR